jgi:DNA (cytosine-5)-methyltransferase 1
MIRAADLFCGAGGASTGLQLAAARRGLGLDLVAINHWRAAVNTHEANHPGARHFCMPVEAVDPRDAVPGGRLDLLVAGPECTHHSQAHGGRPKNDQSRASAWHLLRWAELLKIDRLLIENVPEFQTWGPLGSNQKPLKSRKGETYRAFLAALTSLGYRIESRELNAADYGEAQTRNRLFIQAVKGKRPIVWPDPTHAKRAQASLLRSTERWRGAREVIDWSVPSKSISDPTRRPLSPNTLRKINEGLRKFGGRPFVIGQQGGSTPRVTDEPLPTLATDGAIQLCEPQPFLVPMYGMRPGQTARTHSIDEPVPTIPATGGGKFGLVQPFTIPYCSNGGELVRPVDEPMGTITTKDRIALVIPEGLDVKFRMLQPHELAAAMGFPSSYKFVADTKQDRIKLIGNAWSVRVAEALCSAILSTVEAPASRQTRSVA